MDCAVDILAKCASHATAGVLRLEPVAPGHGGRQLELDLFALPRPFLKWSGGKSRLLDTLIPLLPEDVHRRRHVEPFVGGGALFFARLPERSLLADKNSHLCGTYAAVRDDVEAVIALLRDLAKDHDAARYYERRDRYNRGELLDVERAALFIYLNKTCFNGLHRVNRRGEFNVPMGHYENPRIADADTLRAASRALQTAALRHASFEAMLDLVRDDDFVYFDSPYDVEPGSRNFTAYAGPFGPAEQDALADAFHSLDRRGCKLMLSNSDTTANRARYADYQVMTVQVARSISCDAGRRCAATEIIVRNYA